LALSVIRGTATFWQLWGQSGHAEPVLANLKTENLRRLFHLDREAQSVTSKSWSMSAPPKQQRPLILMSTFCPESSIDLKLATELMQLSARRRRCFSAFDRGAAISE
jgi:hypothetical protein